MATTKVTVTLDSEKAAQIRELSAAGKVASVSGFVQHAVDVALADLEGWSQLLTEALAETGGPLSPDERTWADSVLGVSASDQNRVA